MELFVEFSDQDGPGYSELPNRWQAIEADKIYRSKEGWRSKDCKAGER